MDGAEVIAKPTVAIAGFQHETNTHTPGGTDYSEFLDGGGWPGLTRGSAVLDIFRPLNIPIGGFIKAAEQDGGADLHPILWTSAEPGNRVTTDAFDRISKEILQGVRDAEPDALYLDLHGAMVTDAHDDGETALLAQLRVAFPTLRIAVSLDLHANVGADLARLADVITIYRTYPHLDMDATGARVWDLLRPMLTGAPRPAFAFRSGRAQIPLSAQCTDFGPLKTLYGGLDQIDSAHSADIALGFPLAEIAEAYPSLIVYADDQVAADTAADALMEQLETVAATLENPLYTPEDAITRGLAASRPGFPAVLADVQDNSGAGATADTTGLLQAMLTAGEGECLLGALCDPVVANIAHTAGVGTVISVDLGGEHGPEGVAPLHCEATVVGLSTGVFVCTGAMQKDVETDVGQAALIRMKGARGVVDVLITSRRHQAIDAEVFRHLGADPTAYRLVAVKSTVHFRADFTPLAAEVIAVASPGYSWCR